MRKHMLAAKRLLFLLFQKRWLLKLKYCILLLFAFLLLSQSSLYAQQQTITGTITDENSQPLQGATVQIKGTVLLVQAPVPMAVSPLASKKDRFWKFPI